LAEWFGWTDAEIWDGVPLARALLYWRQAAKRRGAQIGFDLAEMDLIDWMDKTGTKPGEDCTGFFKG
jgi:hypothetical protein